MNRITTENETAVKHVLDDIFDNFDFEKVKKTMDALDWTWAHVGEENEAQARRVPTIDEIKAEAARLMWECANMDTDVLASCGFRVEKDFSDPDDPWMRLTFEVTDWDAAVSELDKEESEDENENNDEDDWVQVFRDVNGKIIKEVPVSLLPH